MKLNKSQLKKIELIKKQGVGVKIIDGEPTGKRWSGWLGLVFDEEGFSGTVSGYNRGYAYSNLGNLFNKTLQCYAYSSRGRSKEATLYVIRTNCKSTLWIRDVFESLIQAY
jgi:hypothetical protein